MDVPETDNTGQKKSEVELLIERISKIQEEIPDHEESDEEASFTTAAEEQERLDALSQFRGGIHRRRGGRI